MIDQKRIGRSFHRGASDYDSHTPVQQRVIQRLHELVRQQVSGEPEDILDIGCGTGLLLERLGQQYRQATLSGLDLAPDMLRQAAQRLGSTARLVQGHAEQLPFSDNSFDLVVSSSTFQWLEQCDTCFGEVRRILRPQGRFQFALFGFGTLYELQESWREALLRCERVMPAGQDGTHRFHTADTIGQALAGQGFGEITVETVQEAVWYDDLPRLLQAIKRIGAGSARPAAGGGLGWRRVLHTMAEIYTARFGATSGVPATYQVVYGAASR